jgi:hypothetical protein
LTARRLAVLAVALAALPLRAQDAEPPVPAISPQVLRAHIRFLADDLLEGRATGSAGYSIAARYVAAQMEALGLAPAGGQGGYFQNVPLREAALDARRSWLRLVVPGSGSVDLRHGEQALIAPSFLRTEDDVDAPVVFAGYGIGAPELEHDDYAGLDVRGKVVAMLQGAPSRFKDVLRAHHGSSRQKAAAAAARGAVGVLLLAWPEGPQFSWTRAAQHAQAPGLRWTDDRQVEGVQPALHGQATLGQNAADRLIAGGGRVPADVYARAAAGERVGFATNSRLRLHTVTRHRALRSPNVAAVLAGSDPALRGETVVFSAHLDHLGVGVAKDGDRIYNGAVDNASGVAALLAVAKAMVEAPRPPRRSVLFVAVTGEEEGLIGSDYFARHAPAAAGTMVANVNIDGLGLLLPCADVVAVGGDSSTLGATARRAAARLGVEVSPDPTPEQALFVRSDQYSFVRRGVPAVFLNCGFKPLQPGRDIAKEFNEWLRTLYHSPQDDADHPLDLDAGARLARLNLLVGSMVADEAERPRWLPGDFFGQTFGGAAAGATGQR